MTNRCCLCRWPAVVRLGCGHAFCEHHAMDMGMDQDEEATYCWGPGPHPWETCGFVVSATALDVAVVGGVE